jgi:prepilin-type N-terminal cleavage/methylation domain-containing protein
MNTIERLREKHIEEGGFTLIELLIVVIILGILAAIVVFSVTGLTNNASARSCQATVKTVDTAAEAYYAQNGTGATLLGQLVPGFLHQDANFTPGSTNSQAIAQGGKTLYTLTFTAGSNTSAGGADTTACPA